MRIGTPRSYIVAIAALFSAYNVLLGVISLSSAAAPVIAGMVLYLAATVLSLLRGPRLRLPVWTAAVATGAAIILVVIVG